MIPENEERLSYHAIRTIVQQSRLRVQQKENTFYNQDVLEALHDLTGLSCSELAEIALQVRQQKDLGFFSIRQQTMIAGGFLLSAMTIVIFAVRLLS